VTSTAKRAAAIGGGVVVLAAAAFFLLGNREGGPLEAVGDIVSPDPAVCPLTGLEPTRESLVERPAVAVKIENASIAYPLSGLEDAEVVYEELVEGGLTRFMAMYHCNDAAKAGPVRSAREVDPSIMIPITRILAAAGGNEAVRSVLGENEVVLVDENGAGEAMERIAREGLPSEHTPIRPHSGSSARSSTATLPPRRSSPSGTSRRSPSPRRRSPSSSEPHP
jgi:hypothetical protein